ncbi:hypothetical protein OWR29_39120 [Actinoplanes sp. Pm04-4]|uniref:Uncharacterized protein n=1 Tax=Paractinoplanes pyxinae TaxID=2997416 RepID=A0ABT4BEP4_9ACTN|nr:hypothetical protein [Actinoplanes pyxinae]MCY1144043.1 hypothetical protein [Actinoplanes pyxinae]
MTPLEPSDVLTTDRVNDHVGSEVTAPGAAHRIVHRGTDGMPAARIRQIGRPGAIRRTLPRRHLTAAAVCPRSSSAAATRRLAPPPGLVCHRAGRERPDLLATSLRSRWPHLQLSATAGLATMPPARRRTEALPGAEYHASATGRGGS